MLSRDRCTLARWPFFLVTAGCDFTRLARALTPTRCILLERGIPSTLPTCLLARYFDSLYIYEEV